MFHKITIQSQLHQYCTYKDSLILELFILSTISNFKFEIILKHQKTSFFNTEYFFF